MSELEDHMESARIEFSASHDWIRGLYSSVKNEDYAAFEGYFCLILRQIERYVRRLENKAE